MSEVIVITSGKGGVGKTTTTANIGIGLAKLGKKVLVIDTDLGLRNLDVVLGLENRIVYNLVDVIEGKCRPKQAIIKDKRFQDLYLLPSAQTKDKSAVSPGQMKKLTAELKEEFDSFFHLPFIFPHITPSFAMSDDVRVVLCYKIYFLPALVGQHPRSHYRYIRVRLPACCRFPLYSPVQCHRRAGLG